jgi:hypothetical protein
LHPPVEVRMKWPDLQLPPLAALSSDGSFPFSGEHLLRSKSRTSRDLHQFFELSYILDANKPAKRLGFKETGECGCVPVVWRCSSRS